MALVLEQVSPDAIACNCVPTKDPPVSRSPTGSHLPGGPFFTCRLVATNPVLVHSVGLEELVR